MRNLTEGKILKVRAIAGLHVVTLAWDFLEGQDAKKVATDYLTEKGFLK